MDRPTREALDALNARAVALGGVALSQLPQSLARCPVELHWQAQPFVAPGPIFEDPCTARYMQDRLHWWDIRGPYRIWVPPPAVSLWAIDWFRSRNPAPF